jgi:protein associated with RNAse G/E
MTNENPFKKKITGLNLDVADAMQESQEQIKKLVLSSQDIEYLLQADDSEVEQIIESRSLSFATDFIRVKTDRFESEQYMKSPKELRAWLIKTNSN